LRRRHVHAALRREQIPVARERELLGLRERKRVGRRQIILRQRGRQKNAARRREQQPGKPRALENNTKQHAALEQRRGPATIGRRIVCA